MKCHIRRLESCMLKKGRRLACIKIEGSKGLMGKEALERWSEYTEELYDKKGRPSAISLADLREVEENAVGSRILVSVVRQDLKDTKNGKATGVNELPTEFLEGSNGNSGKSIQAVQ